MLVLLCVSFVSATRKKVSSETMQRGDDTASAACTSIFCYDPPPMNTPVREGETIEGSRLVGPVYGFTNF